MNPSDLPIDPGECALEYEARNDVHGVVRARVPARLVRRFRKKMRRAGREAAIPEVRSELVRFLVVQAAAREGLRVVSAPMRPTGSTDPSLSLERDFALEAEIDVAARLEIPASMPVELVRPEMTITDALVDGEIARQCIQLGRRSPAERVAIPGVAALRLDLRLAEDEPPIQSAESAAVILMEAGGPLLALGTAFAGGADALAGAGVGETRIIRSICPSNHPVAMLRGRAVHLAATVLAFEAIEPVTIETVLAEYGATSEARFRTQVRFALEQQQELSAQALLREQMTEALEKVFSIGMPECRVRALAGRREAEYRALAKARGWSPERIDAGWDECRAEVVHEAQRGARQRVILQSLPAGDDLELSEATLNARIADLAARQGKRPEQTRAELLSSGRFEEFAAEVAAEAVLNMLVRKATVRTIPMAEWETMRG